MEDKRLKLRNNLRLMYYANGLMVICTLLVFVPVIALVMALVATVMDLVGLVRLRDIHRRYMDALALTAAGFLVGIIPARDGLFGVCLGLVGGVVGLFRFWCVIQATNSFLSEEGQEELVAKGNKIWKYQIILTAVSAICELLGAAIFGEILPVLAVLIVTVVLSIAILGLYIDYLEKSSEVFE